MFDSYSRRIGLANNNKIDTGSEKSDRANGAEANHSKTRFLCKFPNNQRKKNMVCVSIFAVN